jgi:hypothetical protein
MSFPSLLPNLNSGKSKKPWKLQQVCLWVYNHQGSEDENHRVLFSQHLLPQVLKNLRTACQSWCWIEAWQTLGVLILWFLFLIATLEDHGSLRPGCYDDPQPLPLSLWGHQKFNWTELKITHFQVLESTEDILVKAWTLQVVFFYLELLTA